MKKKIKIILSLTTITSIFIGIIKAVDIGSDSAVQRFSTQQILNNGDRIAFFAALEGGFIINSADATATFDSTINVSGAAELALGTLSLSQDLIFSNVAEFKSIGNITGNNHTLEISSSINSIPSTTIASQPGSSTTLLTSQAQANKVPTVDWAYDSQYIAISLSFLDLVRIYSFNGSTLTLKQSKAFGDPLYCVRWHPSNYLLAVGRDRGDEELSVWEFDTGTNDLTKKSSKEIGEDVYAVSWHPSGNYLAAGIDDNTQEIQIFTVSATGVLGSSPVDTVNISATVQQESMDWDNSGEYLAVGVSSSSGKELLVYKFNDQTELLTLNASVELGQNVKTVDWNQTYTNYIAIGLAGSTKRLRVFDHNATAGTLTEIADDSKSITVHALDWSPNGEYIATGRASSATGGNEEFEVYDFDKDAQTLTEENGFNFSSKVEAVRYSPDGQYIAIGTDTNELKVYQAPAVSAAANPNVTFDNLNIILHSNTTIKNCQITFTGNSSIIGRGNCLTLATTSTIIVGSNSNLLLKDIIIDGIHSNRISCADNTSTIELDNVFWNQDDNYNFTTGKLDITGDLEIFGPNKTFSYQSTTTSFIRENGTLILDNNLTFSYNPSISNNQLINLTNNTSKIVLNGATLHASYGLELTKGILEIKRNATLSSEGTTESESIIFGDGSDSSNNLIIKMRPGNKLNVASGKVINKNV